MKDIIKIIEEIKYIKSKDSPDELIEYIININGEYFPSSIMLDKARAILLSEGNEYNLEDAKEIIEKILEVEPDYIPAYIELGYYYDTIMGDCKKAIDIFDRGISIAQQLIDELIQGKEEILDISNK